MFCFLFLTVGESWQNKTFDWSDYLKKTAAKAVPAFMFKHVSRVHTQGGLLLYKMEGMPIRNIENDP